MNVTEKPRCSIKGCVNPKHYNVGPGVPMCDGHFNRVRYKGNVQADKLFYFRDSEAFEITICEVEGCSNPRRNGRYVDGARMYLCARHETRLDRYGSFENPSGIFKSPQDFDVIACQVDRCNNDRRNGRNVLGRRMYLCSAHENRWQKTKDPAVLGLDA